MDILFVSDRYPFPPRDGMDLPLGKCIEALAARHRCRFALLTDAASPASPESARMAATPGPLVSRIRIRTRRHPAPRRLLSELLLRRPVFHARDYDPADLSQALQPKVDLIWSSVSAAGIAAAIQRHVDGRIPLLALGANDCVYGAYLDWGRQFLTGTIGFDPAAAARLLRAPLVALNERRYLRRFDAVHLQNARESRMIRRILPRGAAKPRVIIAQNGYKSELLDLEYGGAGGRKLLLMSQMTGGREVQVAWFLKRVWPEVVAAEPASELELVGPVGADLAKRFLAVRGVTHCGFAPDLRTAFQGKTLAIIPARQACGVVNRVLDSMAAGVPVVGFEDSLGTVGGFENGRFGIALRSGGDFAAGIVDLLRSPGRLAQISAQARAFVRSQSSWEQFGTKIVEESEALLRARP